MTPESSSSQPPREASPSPSINTSDTILQLQQTVQIMLHQQQQLQEQLQQNQQQFLQLQTQMATPQQPNTVREPRARLPDPFNGSPTTVRGFLNQVLLVIQQQPLTYATDTSRVLLIGSLLTGLAREWFNPQFEAQEPALFNNFQQFLYVFRQRFDDPNRSEAAADTLSTIKQGRLSVAEYASHVQQLVADAGWDERAAQHAFRRGLSNEIQDLLLTLPVATSLQQLIANALRLNQRLLQRRTEQDKNRPPPAPQPVPPYPAS